MRELAATRTGTGIAALCLVLLLGCAGAPPGGEAGQEGFEFALIGDQQYDAASGAQFPRLMDHVNRSNIAFVVHIGDFKAGIAMTCDDALYRSRLEQFDASRHPFIYTPGDNEWSDCHNPKAGGFEPEDRLGKLREIFFQGNQSLGQRRLPMRRQSDDPRHSKFRENARWSHGNILFVTLHMVGINNNLGRTAGQDAEYDERNAANLAWLSEAFQAARKNGSRAVAIFTQANPRFENTFPKGRIRDLRHTSPPQQPSGFASFITALEAEVVAYGKPVLLLHGDTHYFRVDKPLFRTGETSPGDRGRQVENFTRVEVFGFPEAHWVRVIVDPDGTGVFTIREEIVEKNRFFKQ